MVLLTRVMVDVDWITLPAASTAVVVKILSPKFSGTESNSK